SGGGGVLALRDADGDGTPEASVTFGTGPVNDVELWKGHLYAALPDRIVRWRLEPGRLRPSAEPEVVVRDLPADGGHVAKSLVIGPDGTMYVNVGSRSNSCQERDRSAKSPGRDPCTELERRAGIWAFPADRTGQRFEDGRRFATGLRNAMALAIQPGTGLLWAAIHGRDQLSDNWGFSAQENAENPAEELVQVSRGDDFGWPYCYYSNTHRRKVLAPEYGGDGERVGRCAKAKDPAVAFPGHWGPMALAFYADSLLGARYRGGAFLAFHGSWNRAPLPQAGYRVVFVPFRDGRPTGEYETFATGTEGPTALRASGVAVGPDGSLYISADQNGKIWRVTRRR
ncbi:MAG TPA: PQQ-dependent sugar dehydrogenase, partial [Gemmatimonadales bacterium]|nr:PQQ-dependent sugar dehydrogenase [Gemmatimonadales bacterium]